MRRVTRLPKDTGPAGWDKLLPPAEPARVLEGSITADWLVIGAGWAGLAAARRLSQLRADDRIVVLEASRVGQGPAGRNSGFMIDLPHKLTSGDYAGSAEVDRLQTEMNRAAIDFAADTADEYEMPEEAFVRSGKVNGAATERGIEQNDRYARHLETLGEAHELLDAAQMYEITGSRYYLGGLFTPGTAMVQPSMFVRSVALGLRPDVDIFEQSPARAFSRLGDDWHVETPNGSVTASRVILAVNGHAESFGYFKRRLVHIHLYASMTRSLSESEVKQIGGQPRWGITPSDPAGSTVRRISGTGGDRIIMRNRMSYTPELETCEDDVSAFGRAQDVGLAARFPALSGVGMEYRWGGRLCLSLNDVPAFGEIDDGIFSACCQNGLGTARGSFAGMMAAELAAQGNNPLAAKLLAFDKPKPLPPEPLARIGATAKMRWREWRAGREL